MYNHKSHINEMLYHYFRNKELDELYISVAIKSFAESFISIFVPIYLLTIGFLLKDVAIYYLVYYASVSLFMPLCMHLNSKIGIKKVMSLGILLLILYYVLLNFMSLGIPYVVVALAFGLSVALYYSSYHLEFAKFCDRKKEATEISILMIVSLAGVTLGPILGSVFITKLSFQFLFILVSILLLISILPLFFSGDKKIKELDFSFKGIVKSDDKTKAIAYQVSGVLGVVSGIFWPIFIYLNLKKMISLGFIISLTSVFMIFFLIFIGKISDKHKERIFGAGILTHSTSWLTRIFFFSPIGLFINNFYSAISSTLIEIPFSKMVYEKSKCSKNMADYFLFREFNLEIGRISILLMAILTNSLYWTFIASCFVTLLYSVLLLNQKKFEKVKKLEPVSTLKSI